MSVGHPQKNARFALYLAKKLWHFGEIQMQDDIVDILATDVLEHFLEGQCGIVRVHQHVRRIQRSIEHILQSDENCNRTKLTTLKPSPIKASGPET